MKAVDAWRLSELTCIQGHDLISGDESAMLTRWSAAPDAVLVRASQQGMPDVDTYSAQRPQPAGHGA